MVGVQPAHRVMYQGALSQSGICIFKSTFVLWRREVVGFLKGRVRGEGGGRG